MTTDAERRADAPRRPGTHHPRLARERALKVLFQADVRGTDARLLLDRLVTTRGALRLLDELEPDEEQVAGDTELQGELARRDRLPLDDYTRLLVDGVSAHRPTIDALLGEVAERWTVERMPALDRNLLRLATYELAGQDTPHAVVIDEALALAAGFAGERSGPFVNGVLETIRRRVEAGEVDLGPTEPAATEAAAVDVAEEATPTLPDEQPETPPTSDPVAAAAWDDALDLLGEDEADDAAVVAAEEPDDEQPGGAEPDDDEPDEGELDAMAADLSLDGVEVVPMGLLEDDDASDEDDSDSLQLGFDLGGDLEA